MELRLKLGPRPGGCGSEGHGHLGTCARSRAGRAGPVAAGGLRGRRAPSAPPACKPSD